MTPARQQVFSAAVSNLKDPAALKTLATAFNQAGLTAHAEILDKRGSLKALPPEQKAARREAFKTGMSSNDPLAIRKLADAFTKEGASGAAKTLQDRAAAIEVANANPSAPTAITTVEPAASLAPMASHPTIRQGSKGDAVKTWQNIIGTNADGNFGPATVAATKSWQRTHGLSSDGVVGPKTWAAAGV
jgi:peptidoglycan hydrolase-like protein with peptidoglycan-binding domain